MHAQKDERSGPGVIDDLSAVGGISDEELTALALAADPDEPLSADAVPLADYLAEGFGPLPEWYMAPVMARHSGRRRQVDHPGRHRRLSAHRGLRAVQHLRPIPVPLIVTPRRTPGRRGDIPGDGG